MAVIKTVGNKGQITLGKQYKGRRVTIEESEPGVWIIKLVPANEQWIHTPKVQADLTESFEWAAVNPPRETDLGELEERLLQA